MTPEKRKELHDLLDKMIDAQDVKFCRIKPAEGDQKAELIRGAGKIVGLIIGITKRVQVMAKDGETSVNKAWTLEPFCIDPTESEAQKYLDHHVQLQGVVDDYNKRSEGIVKEGNEAVDKLNHAMFGEPVNI